jgi:hypothetical protein
VRDVDPHLQHEAERCAADSSLQIAAMEAATASYDRLADQGRRAIVESRQLLADCQSLLGGGASRWDHESPSARRRAPPR